MTVQYLASNEYTAWGLSSTLDASYVTRASMLIDAYCHRTIGVSTYKEQMRTPQGRNRIILAYKPILSFVSAAGRYSYPRRANSMTQVFPANSLIELTSAFGGPPQWQAIDVSQIVWDDHSNTGEAWMPAGIFLSQYTEIQVEYTAGYATIPDAVKMACSMLVMAMQNRPDATVKLEAVNRKVGIEHQFFSDTLMTQEIRALLSPYVTKTLR